MEQGRPKFSSQSDDALVMPFFSVVIPLYNKASTIRRALDSVFAQTFQDFEVIVVNDGSKDGGETIVASYTDNRIRLVHQANQGVSAARNRGIREAAAELVAFLDADDEWMPCFLGTVYKLRIQYPNADLLGTSYIQHNSDGSKRHPVIHLDKNFEGKLEDYFATASSGDPPFCSSSVVIRKGRLVEVGGFPIGVPLGEDLLTWSKVVNGGISVYTMVPCSIWWTGNGEESEHRRIPPAMDQVGIELEKIAKTSGKSVTRYLAMWYKMRASIYLENGYPKSSLKELLLSLKRGGPVGVCCIMIVLAILPSRPSRFLYKQFRRWRQIVAK